MAASLPMTATFSRLISLLLTSTSVPVCLAPDSLGHSLNLAKTISSRCVDARSVRYLFLPAFNSRRHEMSGVSSFSV
jgi:hypothetical protein